MVRLSGLRVQKGHDHDSEKDTFTLRKSWGEDAPHLETIFERQTPCMPLTNMIYVVTKFGIFSLRFIAQFHESSCMDVIQWANRCSRGSVTWPRLYLHSWAKLDPTWNVLVLSENMAAGGIDPLQLGYSFKKERGFSLPTWIAELDTGKDCIKLWNVVEHPGTCAEPLKLVPKKSSEVASSKGWEKRWPEPIVNLFDTTRLW